MTQWRTARLEEVTQVLGGGTPSRKEERFFGGELAWATPTDITSLEGLYISRTKETVTDEGLRSSSTKLMPVGSVLLTSRATIGFTAVASVPICTNQGFVNFICGQDLMPEFLAYWLRTQKQKMLQVAGGTTFKEIARGVLRKFEIAFPGIERQRHMADILVRAEGIVRLRRDAQRKTAEIIPALFLDMFGDPAANPKGWTVLPLGDVLASADYGSSTKASEDGMGLPMIRMGNVDYAGYLDLKNLKYVELAPEDNRRFGLVEGDILFNRTNSKDLVGKTGLWDGSIEAVAASYFIRLRVKRDVINPFFCWAFMNSAHMKRVLFETARGAIGQANINSRELRAFQIMVPPLAQQNVYEKRCRDIFAVQAQQDVATQKAEATFAALLAQVFSDSGGHNAA